MLYCELTLLPSPLAAKKQVFHKRLCLIKQIPRELMWPPRTSSGIITVPSFLIIRKKLYFVSISTLLCFQSSQLIHEVRLSIVGPPLGQYFHPCVCHQQRLFKLRWSPAILCHCRPVVWPHLVAPCTCTRTWSFQAHNNIFISGTQQHGHFRHNNMVISDTQQHRHFRHATTRSI
jgi:hypothetical protein